jgi:hypothetical protein
MQDHTHNTGQRPTAGWALQHQFYALYGSTPPIAVLQADVAKRPPEGADGRCPAAQERLDSGQGNETSHRITIVLVTLVIQASCQSIGR